MSQIYACVAKCNSTVMVIGHNHTWNNFEWKSRLSFLPGDLIILTTTKSGSIFNIQKKLVSI